MENIDRLAKLPLYEKLSVIKRNQAFRRYALSYKAGLVEQKVPIVQLETSRSSITDLFSDLFNETKGFKDKVTVKVLLEKCELSGEIDFPPVYFNSLAETGINHRSRLETSFHEVLYRIDVWINK